MKAHKLQLLEAAKRAGLFDRARRHTASGVRLLNYHGIWTGPDAFRGDSMFIRQATFERRLTLIRDWNYPVVSLHDAVEHLRGRRKLPANSVVITIDDGWLSTFQIMFSTLSRMSMPVTLYCDTAHLEMDGPVPHVAARYLLKIAKPKLATAPNLAKPARALADIATDLTRPYAARLDATEKLASLLHFDFAAYRRTGAFDYMKPSQLADAVAMGDGQLTVELHTHTHSLHDLSPRAIRDEIDDNRRKLAEILNRPGGSFQHFCYPSGIFSEPAARYIESLGLASATTNVQGIAMPGVSMFTLPRITDNEALTELEFEAELSGFSDWLRRGRKLLPFPKRQGGHKTASDLVAIGALEHMPNMLNVLR